MNSLVHVFVIPFEDKFSVFTLNKKSTTVQKYMNKDENIHSFALSAIRRELFEREKEQER